MNKELCNVNGEMMSRSGRVARGPAALALAAALAVPGAFAQANTQQDPAPAPTATQPEDALDPVTRELVDLLVKRKLLTRDEAAGLVSRVRARVEAERQATAAAEPPPGSVRVVYLSEIEKQRVRDEIRKDVMAQAQAEGWAQPRMIPAWVPRTEVAGDVRMRYELDAFDSTNAPFIDFQAINSGAPYDASLNNPDQPPWLNTTEDRQRLRLRARLGLAADVSKQIRGAIRFSTGGSGNPVSADETLGAEFDRLAVSVDQAYVRYAPAGALEIGAGRVPNPFLDSGLVWDEDLNLDGLSTRLAFDDAFLTVGAFTVGHTPFGFPFNRSDKGKDRDKWLYGAQLGGSLDFGSTTVTLASSYYHYENIEGKRSSPCRTFDETDPCDTDPSRPGFIQKGNTLFAVRDVETDPGSPEFQYFGLASKFRELAVNLRFDVPFAGPVHAVLDLEGVVNLEYDKEAANDKVPVNNYGALKCDPSGQSCTGGEYDGGFTGYLVQALLGHVRPEGAGTWNVVAGVRRLESDAVVDAFADSDFHMGGTNAKGFTVGGALGIADGAALSFRWLSSTEVSGAPFANDVYQVDLSARF